MALSAEDLALRSELSEARFGILRQLELLRLPGSVRGALPGNRPIVARLKQQLAEIEEALADLDG